MGAADDLALRALSTPALDASDALDVLVDVLLEAGILSGDVGALGSDDDLPEPWRAPSIELRRRAHRWAKRRLAPPPNPTQQLVDIVWEAVTREELPYAIVGVVAPFIIRVHFVDPVDAHHATVAREAIQRHLPASIVVEVTGRPLNREHAVAV